MSCSPQCGVCRLAIVCFSWRSGLRSYPDWRPPAVASHRRQIPRGATIADLLVARRAARKQRQRKHRGWSKLYFCSGAPRRFNAMELYRDSAISYTATLIIVSGGGRWQGVAPLAKRLEENHNQLFGGVFSIRWICALGGVSGGGARQGVDLSQNM